VDKKNKKYVFTMPSKEQAVEVAATIKERDNIAAGDYEDLVEPGPESEAEPEAEPEPEPTVDLVGKSTAKFAPQPGLIEPQPEAKLPLSPPEASELGHWQGQQLCLAMSSPALLEACQELTDKSVLALGRRLPLVQLVALLNDVQAHQRESIWRKPDSKEHAGRLLSASLAQRICINHWHGASQELDTVATQTVGSLVRRSLVELLGPAVVEAQRQVRRTR
jgi:hypothetical protein